ncbi:MAG: single-stranded DNA-binding protein [Flavobacteriales bacterium]
MSKLNRYSFIGNLGADAEVRTINDNQRAVISFLVAITDKWKDQQGNPQEKTTWVKCSIWRKPDQTGIAQYLKKGQQVLIEGEPSARSWTDKDGNAQASLECTVREVALLGGASQPGAAPTPRPAAPTMGGQPMSFKPPQQTPAPPAAVNPHDPNAFPDDLPF